jgi:signal transduction histidine kinase
MSWITGPRTLSRRELAAWTRLACALPGQAAEALRHAVAAVLAPEPRARPGRLGIWLDVLLALFATIAVLAMIGKATPCPTAGPFSACPAVANLTTPSHHFTSVLIAVMTTVPLAWRRLRPLTAFWVIIIAAVAAPHLTDNVVTLVAVVLAAYSAVVHSRFRLAAMISVPLAGLLVATAFPTVVQPLRLPGQVAALLGLMPVLYVGQAVHQWRGRVRDSQARLDRMQADHEAATTLALATERARIASELHDVVTHNVSVMIVQAGAARHVLTDSPGAATDALLAVESSGRAAMAELRHLLGLLSPIAGVADTDQLQPQPGLGQLGLLTDRVRAAGLDVQLRAEAPLPDLPPGLDLTAYRVIQEALTNVLKHAGTTGATVSLSCERDRLAVCVTDPGPREPAPVPGTAVPGTAVPGTPVPGTAVPGTTFRADVAVPGAGRGLLGLHERVALYGGEFTAGPRPGGGWRVRASLPLDAVPAGPEPATAR